MVNNSTFSIIIPAKNEEAHIALLLKDIREQSVQPNEIIVASSSTDATNEIAVSFGALITEGTVDGYIGKARNLGAKKATGKILIFLDADARLSEKNVLAKIVHYFKHKNLAVATTLLTAGSTKTIYKTMFKTYNLFLQVESTLNVMLSAPGICLLISRENFDEVGGFSSTLKNSEDIDLIRRVMRKGNRYSTVPYHIVTSVRRFENKSAKQMAQLVFAAMLIPLILQIRSKHLAKYLKKLEGYYGKTGGAD